MTADVLAPITQRIYAAKARGDGHNGLGIAGDCMRACVASALNLGYNEVPHFVHYGDGRHVNDDESDDPLTEEHGPLCWRRFRRWLRARDLDAVCIQDDILDHARDGWPLMRPETVEGDRPPWPWPCDNGTPYTGFVLAAGQSPRGPFGHLTVGYYDGHAPAGERLTIVHDPHPSRQGIVNGAAGAYSIDVFCAPYEPAPPLSEVPR